MQNSKKPTLLKAMKTAADWCQTRRKALGWLMVAVLLIDLTFYTKDVLFWIILMVVTILADYVIQGIKSKSKKKKSSYLPSSFALVLASILFTFTLLDGALVAMTHISKPQQQLVMPKEWEMRDVKVPGAARAYYWHNILHVFDENGFRRTTPFLPKKEGVYRIMLVGDSLTYGQAVENNKIYASLIEKKLRKEGHNVEVFNLGAMGRQSEDMVKNVKKFFPIIQPDLVIYGICVNDFLPADKGEYNDRSDFSIPLPDKLKTYFLMRSKSMQFVDEQYGKILRKFNLRSDFFTDILKDFDGYRTRFAKDLTEMNQFVTNNGLPPVIAIVLNQFPSTTGVAFETTNYAEGYAKEAKMTVVPSLPYNKKYEGQILYVSQWDGHPNAKAHAIFADLLMPAIEKQINRKN